MSIMSETTITDFQVVPDTKSEFSLDEDITVNVRFSITGGLRDSFTEKNWTEAYDQNDNTIKLKYGVKLSKGGLRKHDLGKPIDTYRKASIFWTRNPKLVNPMKERRIWVQVAKNFEPFIRLTEEDVRQEFFDFDGIFGGHKDGLVLGRWRHMDAGAHIGHQQELADPPPLVLERHNIAR